MTVVHAPTEARNPRTVDIDTVGVAEALRLINEADAEVPAAVSVVLPQIAAAVEAAVRGVRAGGRVHYVGAGSSGRIAAVDAAELVPTYNVAPDLFMAHVAGGLPAMLTAVEGVEDDEAAGAATVASVGPHDLVVGIAASGRTPYVAGALRRARDNGATTVLLSANVSAPLASLADIHIGVDTGAEVIAGSTRMKAATAQKLVLNAFSTAVMVQLGHTYSNLMVDMIPLNGKLRGRLVSLLHQASGVAEQRCAEALEAAGDVKVALVCLVAGVEPVAARGALAEAGGVVRVAVDRLSAG
jgi:N-acetylmuramic acid 6-phosphate etherase